MTTVDGNFLTGVSTTTLWTLHNRAAEARRADGLIHDPWAVKVLDAIGYDYGKFGRPAQQHVLRALMFGVATGAYLKSHPKASVVALAEGLASQLLAARPGRLGGGRDRVLSRSAASDRLREQLLPRDERIVELAQSALDRSWMDHVDASHGVFITAEGLLMYLDPANGIQPAGLRETI
jgi:O-methyltransferase involved in polyketide biosynthesis